VTPRPEHGRTVTRYPLRFGTAAFLLIAVTLVLVLFVIPERYVLSPGFRESGANFPAATTPFVPVMALVVTAPPLPVDPGAVAPGPAETLWAEVLPLFEAGQPGAAVPLFESYLARYPEDRDARRELVATLLASGRPAEAVPVLRALLRDASDVELGLVLARTLRDMGRIDEASDEYQHLAEARRYDGALMLEWAQALAWAERHEAAVDVLASALDREPTSIALRVELAQAYYALGRLHDAVALLAAIEADDLSAAGAQDLWSDVLRSYFALAPEVVPTPPPATLLERAQTARFSGDSGRARALLEEAIADRPNDRSLWLAYADLLEYELADHEGARTALLGAERLGALDPSLQLRLAQLEAWTGRSAQAAERLEALLASLDAGAIGSAAVPRADVLAFRGDLERWRGDRIGAARSYRMALASDPESQRARDGLAALDAEVAEQVVALEAPGIAGVAYSLADTDDFVRVDAGGAWNEVAGRWVWGGSAGQRWLAGNDLGGLDASRHGTFVDLAVARWWRRGTLRTGFDVGAERLRSSWDVRVGGSIRHRAGPGSGTELRFVLGPAHPLANTLQSVLADVVQERLSLSHTRPLGERWTLDASLDGARLQSSSADLTADPNATHRLQLAVTAGRTVNRSLTVGLTARGLTFTDEAPSTTTGAVLFWDPAAAVSAAPYARLSHEISPSWRVTGTLSPGLALIDERRPADTGFELVPHVAADVGLRHEGRLSTALELFYYQGQFTGYRSYGARVTVRAADLSGLEGAR
jgi:predicted Zn-dependent protease